MPHASDRAARPLLSPAQWSIAVVVVAMVLGLVGVSVWTQRIQQEREAALARTEGVTTNSLFMLRETMNFTSTFQAYLEGQATRRQVQIARALLVRRLAVVDQTGQAGAARTSDQFRASLADLGAAVDAAPTGTLAATQAAALAASVQPEIEQFQSRCSQGRRRHGGRRARPDAVLRRDPADGGRRRGRAPHRVAGPRPRSAAVDLARCPGALPRRPRIVARRGAQARRRARRPRAARGARSRPGPRSRARGDGRSAHARARVDQRVRQRVLARSHGARHLGCPDAHPPARRRSRRGGAGRVEPAVHGQRRQRRPARDPRPDSRTASTRTAASRRSAAATWPGSPSSATARRSAWSSRRRTTL